MRADARPRGALCRASRKRCEEEFGREKSKESRRSMMLGLNHPRQAQRQGETWSVKREGDETAARPFFWKAAAPR